MEAICKYLKEELSLNYSKIALLLNRDSRTIWATYNNSIRKGKEKLLVKESRFFIPVSALADRSLSVLECIVCYLKDSFKLRYSQIAVLLNRDERNIWAAYKRAMKKKAIAEIKEKAPLEKIEKLEKELKALESAYKSGFISKESYEKEKARIEAELRKLKK